jgi:peptidyl-prolyl cis-trans isomerase SurA
MVLAQEFLQSENEFPGSHPRDALYQGTTLVGPHKAQTSGLSAPGLFICPVRMAGAEAQFFIIPFMARLMSCPDTKPKNSIQRESRKGRLKIVVLLLALSMLGTTTRGQENAGGSSASGATPGVNPPISPVSVPPIPKGAVVLDHVVAVINGSVILQSDVTEEMAYAFLQPFTAGASNTPQRALQRLIDRDLILQQMETAQTVTPPTPEEVQQRIAQLRGVIPECLPDHCQTDAGWQAFLRAKGLTEKEVDAHWAQRMLILSFIQSRFGAGVRITPPEIADYYNKTLAPQLRAKGVKPPALEAVSPRIEEILLQQRVSSLLLEWLQSLKSEGSVSILDPVYGKVGTTGLDDAAESGGRP